MRNLPAGIAGAGRSRISCLGARQLLDHALAGPLPLLQEDQEIGHLLPVRPLVELPDHVGANLAGGCQDPKEICPGRSVPAEVILDRIARRSTNDFGKTSAEREMILDELAKVEPLLRASCTHELDASRPLAEVVADLTAIASRPVTTS